VKLETIQTLCQVTIFLGIVLTALAGFGNYWFGGKISAGKEKLHREDMDKLHSQLQPFADIAVSAYPGVETKEALEQLAKEIETTRSLATRNVYKPLAEEQKRKLIETLSAFRKQHTAITPSVIVYCQQGSSTRTKVADDLELYLKTAGYKAEMQPYIQSLGPEPSDVYIGHHPEDIELAKQFAGIVANLFINTSFEEWKGNDLSPGNLFLLVNGDPLFTDSGIVKFK